MKYIIITISCCLLLINTIVAKDIKIGYYSGLLSTGLRIGIQIKEKNRYIISVTEKYEDIFTEYGLSYGSYKVHNGSIVLFDSIFGYKMKFNNFNNDIIVCESSCIAVFNKKKFEWLGGDSENESREYLFNKSTVVNENLNSMPVFLDGAFQAPVGNMLPLILKLRKGNYCLTYNSIIFSSGKYKVEGKKVFLYSSTFSFYMRILNENLLSNCYSNMLLKRMELEFPQKSGQKK